MTTFDFSPLFRSTIGFDRLTRLMDTAAQLDSSPAYPPYNIEATGENAYRLTMAVAGFGADATSSRGVFPAARASGPNRAAERCGRTRPLW